MSIATINPATGETVETFQEMAPADLDAALASVERAWLPWRDCKFADRAQLMREAGRMLRRRKEEYARTMAIEMGKPVVQGEAEAEKCASACDYFAEHAEAFLTEQHRRTDASRSTIRFEPLGPVLAVMPWNFPFWQVFRFAAPALMAGNAAILKHASNVPRCALEIEEIFRQAGFPEGLFRTVLVGADKVSRLISDPRIRAVTLTGSEAAGSRVAEQSGREIKKTVLELGGSDPFIVLDDIEIKTVAKAAADGRLINSGQSCIAAKRFIVLKDIAETFVNSFVAEMQARKLGDPLDRATQVGPQARDDLRAVLHRQVQESVQRGAKLLLGGRIPEGPGAFYPPTVLDFVTPGMPAFDEETFGPVAAVIRAGDEADAVRFANQSRFGLGASIWTEDRERAEQLVPLIESGSVFVNGLVKSDPRLPFGGIKRSGYGRELSEYGIWEFVNIKTVWMANSAAAARKPAPLSE